MSVDSEPAGSEPTGSDLDRPSGPPAKHRGHRLVPHTSDCIIEAWGPDRLSCVCEAMSALVEVFAETPDEAVSRTIPLSVEETSDRDLLVALLEEEIYTIDVLGVVPIGFHLANTEDGGVAGDMDVVDAHGAELVGPVPKAVSYHDLEFAEEGGEWRCHVLVDV